MEQSSGANTRQTGGKNRQIPERYAPGWLDDLDGRLGLTQSMRARYHAITDDLGGADTLSYAQRSLIERALWIEYWISQQERGLATGGEFSINGWVSALNTLQGLFAKLGLERRAREVPDLQTYLKKKSA